MTLYEQDAKQTAEVLVLVMDKESCYAGGKMIEMSTDLDCMSSLNCLILTGVVEIQGPFLGTPDCWGNPCWQWIGSWGQLKESVHL